jgi:hypothetical protein
MSQESGVRRSGGFPPHEASRDGLPTVSEASRLTSLSWGLISQKTRVLSENSSYLTFLRGGSFGIYDLR